VRLVPYWQAVEKTATPTTLGCNKRQFAHERFARINRFYGPSETSQTASSAALSVASQLPPVWNDRAAVESTARTLPVLHATVGRGNCTRSGLRIRHLWQRASTTRLTNSTLETYHSAQVFKKRAWSGATAEPSSGRVVWPRRIPPPSAQEVGSGRDQYAAIWRPAPVLDGRKYIG
jgi:hypothetical protein